MCTITTAQLAHAHAAIAYHVRTLREMPYPEYLLTTHWQWTRYRKLAQAGYRCERCHGTAMLEVHHKTYERIGQERMDDLTVLCDRCHRMIHGLPIEKRADGKGKVNQQVDLRKPQISLLAR